ncbi:hypothetical protein [Streptomyces griseosporeus]|jgi:hypothetical protein|uniref:hypothetical protein n=1 Tax=Streptomyces griseosporeus TaxID=1910 RepID=UPI00369F0425
MAPVGAAQVWVWVTAVVAGLVTAGLVLVMVLVDMDTAGQVATVAGTVLSAAALLVSVLALAGAGGSGRTVRAGRDGIAVGGHVTGSALGRDAKVSGAATPPAAPAPAPDADVRSARGGVATGGDVTDSALGPGSRRDLP